jgi:transposase-like protein
VWLYFPLSFRDVEEMLAMRGVKLSYETIRERTLKFGQTYTNGLRRRSPRPGDRWHLDEVFLKINGHIHYLWRAVDQDGMSWIPWFRLPEKKAAKKFLSQVAKGVAVRSACNRHRRAEKLRRGEGRSAAERRASSTANRRIRTTELRTQTSYVAAIYMTGTCLIVLCSAPGNVGRHSLPSTPSLNKDVTGTVPGRV